MKNEQAAYEKAVKYVKNQVAKITEYCYSGEGMRHRLGAHILADPDVRQAMYNDWGDFIVNKQVGKMLVQKVHQDLLAGNIVRLGKKWEVLRDQARRIGPIIVEEIFDENDLSRNLPMYNAFVLIIILSSNEGWIGEETHPDQLMWAVDEEFNIAVTVDTNKAVWYLANTFFVKHANAVKRIVKALDQ